MSEIEVTESGFSELSKLLEDYQVSESDALRVLEEIAGTFAQDVRKLPKPRSTIATAGYTHLLDTVTHRKKGKEIESGWGKYYGPMVEKGTKKMRGTPHIKQTFHKNQEKYFKRINEKIFK